MDLLWCHWGSNTPLLSPQGTTVRMITAVDQDKGRPRGIGYTIVSGESWWDAARGMVVVISRRTQPFTALAPRSGCP